MIAPLVRIDAIVIARGHLRCASRTAAIGENTGWRSFALLCIVGAVSIESHVSRYVNSADFRHEAAERIGVLLVNSGTPDSPRPGDVRSFLRALLSDPRVVELPRALWLPILHGIILRTRPRRSARKYRKIWTAQGSPLLARSEELRAALSRELAHRVIAPIGIELGMLYAKPTVPEALARLREAGAQRLLVLPLFPQYCAATTGAVFDQVTAELRRWRWLPETRFVSEYHDHPSYVEGLRASVSEHWATHGRTEHLVMSFHSIPAGYFKQGDPYYCKCQKTARLLADELALREGEWSLTFQSKFGPGRWLGPYTDRALCDLVARGTRTVTVLCPGFAVDCLETLEEIDIDYRKRFVEAGGVRLQYVPALNARPEHARALADVIAQHCEGWTSAELGRLGLAASATNSRTARDH
jgi:ferrochelatase